MSVMVTSTEFLGLIIDETLLWKNRVDQLMPKLSSSCYAVRTVKAIVSQETFEDYLFFVRTLCSD